MVVGTGGCYCGSGCCEWGFGGFGVVFRGFSFANAGVWVGDAAVAGLVFFVSVWEKEKDVSRRPQK